MFTLDKPSASLRALTAAGALCGTLLFGGVDASAQASFDAICAAEPNTTILTRGATSNQPTRTIYRYVAPTAGTAGTATVLGEVSARLNGVGLYDGFLYGLDRETFILHQVASNGVIVSTTAVPGLPQLSGKAYISGSVDEATGFYYINASNERSVYRIDLDNVAAGAVEIPVTLDGNRIAVSLADMAYYEGALYGYSRRRSSGITIDVATGEATLFPITGGLPDASYGSAWIDQEERLVISRETNVYEIDITGPTWVLERQVVVPELVGNSRDGTACPVVETPPPTFGCDINQESAFITGSESKLGSRALYRYTPAPGSGTAVLDSLGEIEAPLNAFGLYGDTLYGMHRTDGRLFKVAADGTLLDSLVVPGLPVMNFRSYIAGTVDQETGNFYVFARYFRKAYVFNLNDIGAGATKIPFTQDIGNVVIDDPVLMDFADFAYFNGFLYGYDILSAGGFTVNVQPGADFGNVEFFDVEDPSTPGEVTNQLYPGTWFSPRGTLFLYKDADDGTYELDITRGNSVEWQFIQRYDSSPALLAQRDAASCGGPPVAPEQGSMQPDEEVAALSAKMAIPTTTTLGALFPNPVRDRATVTIGLPEDARATVSVYDVVGRRVAVLFDGEAEAGWTEATFEASGLAAGTYIVQLRTPTGAATGKLVVID